jgi:hypothetical protein
VNLLRHALVMVLLFSLLGVGAPSAVAGPFENFFKKLHRALMQPNQPPPRHTGHKRHTEHKESADASGVHSPPNERNVRSARTAPHSSETSEKPPFAVPVPGKPGFVMSPFAPDSGYIDVRNYPPGSEVKDPYTGKTFRTP